MYETYDGENVEIGLLGSTPCGRVSKCQRFVGNTASILRAEVRKVV